MLTIDDRNIVRAVKNTQRQQSVTSLPTSTGLGVKVSQSTVCRGLGENKESEGQIGLEWPKFGERKDLLMVQNTQAYLKHGGGNVMARACMAASGKASLVS